MVKRNIRYIIADISSFIIIAVGFIVIFGILFNSNYMKSVFFVDFPMKAVSSMCFLTLGIALFLLNPSRLTKDRIIWARILSIFVSIAALLNLLEYIFTITLGIDLFPSADLVSAFPGRMPINSALNFLLAGVSMFLLSRKYLTKYELVRVLLIIMGFISLLAVIGFFSGIREYESLYLYNPMPIETALLFLILFTGMVMIIKTEFQPMKKLEVQTIIGFGIALITIIVIGVIALQNSHKVIHANKSTNRTFLVVQNIEEILSLAKDLETGVRGYVITKDSAFLEPYYESREPVRKALKNIRIQVSDYSIQKKNVDTLEDLVNESYRYLSDLILIRNEKGLQPAIKYVATQKGKRIMDQIRVVAAEMKKNETDLLIRRSQFEDESSRNSISILLIFIFIPFALLVFIYVILRRNIIENYRNQELMSSRSVELEQRFRILFNEMPDGFSLNEMIFDENNKPLDYRFIEVNPAFESLTGLKREQVMGKTIREIAPEIEQYWIDIYGEVVLKGKNIRYENYAKAFNKYYEVSASPFGEKQFITIFTDITERKRSEETIKASLKEKEVLLRELYHRTKNNMQVISSFIGLKSDSIKDPNVKVILADMKNRIQTIALVHQKLYQSKNLSRVDLKEYITDLSELLLSSYNNNGKTIDLILDLESINVLIDTAIPCGLIINELVSNSLKYAFPGCEKGELKISLKQKENDLIELTIADNGIGFPEDYNPENTNKLGLLLFKTIAEDQLQGEVIFNVNNGVSTIIRFRDIHYEERV